MLKPAHYDVDVTISNRPQARDPEGETIHRELIAQAGYAEVKEVRVAKLLKIRIAAASPKEARHTVWKICNELRIFNPAAHVCTVSVGPVAK